MVSAARLCRGARRRAFERVGAARRGGAAISSFWRLRTKAARRRARTLRWVSPPTRAPSHGARVPSLARAAGHFCERSAFGRVRRSGTTSRARARRGGIVARRNSVSAGASSHLAVSAPRSRWRRDDLRSHQALRPAPREPRHVRTVRHASGVRRAQLLVVPLAQARLRGVHVAALAAGMRAARGGREGGGAHGRQGAAVRAVDVLSLVLDFVKTNKLPLST